VQWGMAADGQNVYASVSDAAVASNLNGLDPKQGGGLTALRITDGSRVWHKDPVPCGDRPRCSPAQSAALTGIPGVIFSPSMDGHLRAYTTEEGNILWDFDTVRDYQTVNGVKAKGGSIDGPGAVIVNGMLFINSGYSRFGGIPGNVLLAFAPAD
jgi:polyvinyl alcohol dehydrogenase (cytochrome)